MPATRRGFGRLRKRESGRWQAGYVGPDGELHNAPETFTAKTDAEGWLAAERRLIERDDWTAPTVRNMVKHERGQTLGEFATVWLTTHRRSDGQPLKDRTRAHYRSLLGNRILPTFGDMPMRHITNDAVERWFVKLPKTPVANAHAYALLTEILKSAAVKDPRIVPVTVKGASKARTTHRAEPATLDELAVIVANMPERHRVTLLLMSWCALRFGEVTELRRRDVDLSRGVLRIRRAVVLVEGERRVTTPKSEAGIRDVAIPPHLLDAIREHLAVHAAEGPDGLLFPADRGGHLSQSTLNGKPSRRRLIKGRLTNESASGYCRAREAAGRPDLRLHDLRHTGAVLAAQTGATLAELMERLGHSTPQAAMRYQHVGRGRQREVAEALSQMAGRL